MKEIRRYCFLWLLLAKQSFLVTLSNRLGIGLFLFAKILRFFVYFFFFYRVAANTTALLGYSPFDVLVIILTFNLIDTLTQLLFREVYRFGPLVASGDFDLTLVRPISPLFRSLLSGADVIDLFMFVILCIVTILVIPFGNGITLTNMFWWGVFCLNGIVLGASFHILILAGTIYSTHFDAAIMIYRTMTRLGRMPADMYAKPLRYLFFSFLPIGIMFTFPVIALRSSLSPQLLIGAVLISYSFFLLSIVVWQQSLKSYSSASS